MSLIGRAVEKQLADAAAAGELVPEQLKGKPIPGLDQQRSDGWWAKQFVKRELSHDRRKVAIAEAAKRRVAFWKAKSLDELRDLVSDANEALATANINLTDADQIELFDFRDTRNRWSELRRS